MLLQRLATGATGVKQARYRRGPTRGSEALYAHAQYNGVQWNLRIKDKLVHGPLSTIRGLSFIGEFLSKSLFCVL